METDKLYKALFYLGGGWNFLIATALFVLTGSLPSLIGIEPPRYPIFIYFNLTSIFFFGIMQIMIARHLHEHRDFVKMLMCAKLAMGAVLLYAILVDAPPKELVSFLAPGIVLDVIFGLLFWRFLVFSRARVSG
jgi:ABC-type enterochelin transport system permease subunit